MRRLVVALRSLVAAVLLTAGLGGCLPGGGPGRPASAWVTVRELQVGGAPLAYCGNGSLDSIGPDVARVIIAVHGLDRNACGMAEAALSAAGRTSAGTLIVAPAFATRSEAKPDGLYWDPMMWPQGDQSLGTTRLSSFAVVDDLVRRVGDREVVVAGFSGGGQFVNRYAATTRARVDRFVVMNPSTYLYFTPERRGATATQLAACVAYDDYRYGLEHLTGYAAVVGATRIRQQYPTRSVTYLIGTADDDPRSPSMDRTCPAMAQGPDRETRAYRYHQHLADVFGPDILRRQPLHPVEGAGHNPGAVLNSGAGREALFGALDN